MSEGGQARLASHYHFRNQKHKSFLLGVTQTGTEGERRTPGSMSARSYLLSVERFLSVLRFIAARSVN